MDEEQLVATFAELAEILVAGLNVIDFAHLLTGLAVLGPFDPAAVHVGQTLADVATISLLGECGMRHSGPLNEQLRYQVRNLLLSDSAQASSTERKPSPARAGRSGRALGEPVRHRAIEFTSRDPW